jgi:hypothetical protein
VTEPTVIYVADFGETKLAVAQLGDRVAVTIDCAEGVAAVKLSAEQAVALAISILAGNLEALREFAGRVDAGLAMQISACLLAPQVRRQMGPADAQSVKH